MKNLKLLFLTLSLYILGAMHVQAQTVDDRFLLDEGFESSDFPEGWTIHKLIGETGWGSMKNNDSHHGGKHASIGSIVDGRDMDAYLVTPAITLPKNETYTLRFWLYGLTNSKYDGVVRYREILVSTTDNQPASFTPVKRLTVEEIEQEGIDKWKRFDIPLDKYAGKTIYIAFRYVENLGFKSWYIDDVSVYKSPNSCAMNAPYEYGFENSIPFDDCWTQVYVRNAVKWDMIFKNSEYYDPASSHSGKFFAVFNRSLPNSKNENGNKTKLVTPPLNWKGLKYPVLKFWNVQKERGWSKIQDKLRIYYKTSAKGTWVLLKEYLNNIPTWQEQTVYLPANSADDCYIAFEGEDLNGEGIALDDIRIIEGEPYCDLEVASIKGLPALGINLSAAEKVKVQLNNYSNNAISGFQLKLELDENEVASETYSGSIPALGQTEYVFTKTLDLSAASDYQIKVTAFLTGDQDAGNDSKTIKINNTICNVVNTFPYTMGFEDNGKNFPDCWRQEYWTVETKSNSILPHSGTYMAEFYKLGSGTSKLITQPIDLSGISRPVLKFWHTQWVVAYTDGLNIYYKPSLLDDWKLIASFNGSVGAWTERMVELPEPSAKYFIAFEGSNKSVTNIDNIIAVRLDDITISESEPRIDAGVVSANYNKNTGKISALIRNYGNTPINAMKISCKLNDGTPVTEQLNVNIAPLVGTVNHTFAATMPQGYCDVEVSVETAGDQNQNNNAKKIAFVNYPEITMFGYCTYSPDYNMYSHKIVSFNTTNPQTPAVQKKYMYATGENTVCAGEYIDKKLYLFTAAQGFSSVEIRNLVVLSTENWSVTNTVPLSIQWKNDYHNDMTYDYTANTMYSIRGRDLQKVDMETGGSSVIKDLGIRPIGLACNLAGEMFAVDTAGYFYSIDKTTFDPVKIGNTGFKPRYKQSMAFHHDSGRLLWAAVNQAEQCILFEIDIKTGKAYSFGTLGNGTGIELSGLYSTYVQEEGFYRVALQSNTMGGGVLTGFGKYKPNEQVTITAVPTAGYEFVRWEKDGATVSTKAAYTFSMPAGNVVYSAVFNSSTGINELSAPEINIYSNKNQIFISNTNGINIKSIQVTDMAGRTVYQSNNYVSDSFSLDVATGIYIVKLISADGKIFVKKIHLKN